MTEIAQGEAVQGVGAVGSSGQQRPQDAPAGDDAEREILHNRYETLEPCGNGVYGTVHRARDLETQEIVAVKRLHIESDHGEGVPTHVIREVSLLRDFEHPNIVRLIDILATTTGEFTLVFEFIEVDLYKYLRGFRRNQEQMPIDQVKMYGQQLITGIFACHTRCIMHRDLKPQNILIAKEGLKICDFGLSRIISVPVTRPYTHDVVTLWYRAPEILLGAHCYGQEVDVWSAGCVLAEMATGVAIFAGDSEIGTIFKILKMMGTPTEETWKGFSQLDHWQTCYPNWRPTNLMPVLEMRPELGEDGIELLKGLLMMNPTSRTSARRAQNHHFFQPAPASAA